MCPEKQIYYNIKKGTDLAVLKKKGTDLIFTIIKVCPWLVLLAWHTNEHLICTSLEFWHLFFTLHLLELDFAKTQKNVRFEIKMCPCFNSLFNTNCLSKKILL